MNNDNVWTICFTAVVIITIMIVGVVQWKRIDTKRMMEKDRLKIEHDRERPRKLWEKDPKTSQ